MLYRWGFIDNGVFTECKPIVDDNAAIDFAPQTNEVFYRAKLNGGLSFRFEFDDILARGYNYEHIIVLQYYNEDLNEWGEVWRGRFALTDCEIDFDTHTISVQPETQDRYTKVLDALDKEYNLVKLAPAQQAVNILIRPCLQIYKFGSDKITNFIGGNAWNSTCDTPTTTDDIIDTFKFTELRDCLWFTGTYKSGVYEGKKAVFYGRFLFIGADMNFPLDGRVYNDDGTFTELDAAFRGVFYHDTGHRWLVSIIDVGTSDMAIACFYDDRHGGDENESYTEGNIFENTYLRWDRVFGRTICNTDAADVTIGGNTYTLYDIAANDMAGSNMNYNKIMQAAFAVIEPSIDTDVDPTMWPQDSNERYFVKPQNTPTRHYFAAAPETWIDVAYWWYASAGETIVEERLTTARTIKDAYEYRAALFKLLAKADFNPQYIISGCLGGTNDYVGTRAALIITPRSNVISSYYETPAQNAPITLAKVFNMLKQAYKAYWYIDSNGNLHIEHISYYENGYSYSDADPVLLVDLESRQHTNTKENKVFGQNKIKYDKQDMPEQFKFGWGDTQTRPFDGYPILCKDNYVQKGTTSDHIVADFDTDVDFVLSSPNDVSKDGFFLFALPPKEGGTYYTTLKVETVQIEDENGEPYEVKIQNGNAAFVNIHKTWWRYSLPCENINVNNQDTTAITTGRYKLQNVEFADEIMAEILKDIDNCNKVIRTQQGDGKIKSLSINLNSLKANGDLLFNFVGRWYYLRGTALGASIIINVNNEPITIEVSDNKWRLKYAEPMTALDFNGADVVSVNFADCDRLENLTSADGMFENCAELLAVDFGGKKLAAVTSAVDMFAGCAQLTTLICPQTSTWKPDLSFADCPDLTLESIYSLIGFLFDYDSGVHTIDFNSTMWNALDADTQTDITTKAGEKGWTIGTAVAYYISGQSAAGTVYATINGASVEIPVSGGAFNYSYYTPITSISFENDADVTDIDFSLSDGLAGVTSLANAFKNCAGLTTIDFTNCDLSNVTTAADCFAGCVALYTLEIPTGTWKPDVDLSDTVILYSEMLNVVDGLYTYSGGFHNVTFNSTIWDAMSVAEQQAVFDAAGLKYWTTNSVAVLYYIRGTSTNVNGTESFSVQFIDDDSVTPSAVETITCAVDGNGYWEYSYSRKKIYSMVNTFVGNTTITEVEFTEDFESASSLNGAFAQMQGNVSLPNAIISNALCSYMFYENKSNTISAPNATFNGNVSAYRMFNKCECEIVSLPSATFANVTDTEQMFYLSKIKEINLPLATFTTTTTCLRMFSGCTLLTNLSLPLATFASATNCSNMFEGASSLSALTLPNATFASATDIGGIFANLSNCLTINVPNATFANATIIYYFIYQSAKIITIDATSATFANATTTTSAFQSANALTNILLGEQNVAIANSATAANIDMRWSPLSYQSMLNVANLVNDRTNLSALTITFKATAWNALSAAEQTTIDGILSGKNWTRAIA